MTTSPESLLMELITAGSEEEVTRIVQDHSDLSRPECWRPYGSQTSIGTFLTQQESPVAALAEKITNSIDALLMKECALRGIDPSDGSAPGSMRQAVDRFYGIKGGDYSELGETARRELARNIWVIAEGDKKKPSVTVVDRGEGQHPEDFADTLVSIHRTAKRDIRFVQGRFHMGATGVLPNCGEKKYQLLLSRKHPQLLKAHQADRWGFTLVRLHPLESGERTPWFEYCVEGNGHVYQFEGKDLDLLPEDEVLSWGTYVKMFDYDLPHPSNITLDLWRELNRMLPQPALPVLLYERRDFRGRVRSKVLLGNRMRLAVDQRGSVEPGFPVSITATLGRLGRRDIEVTVLRAETSKSEFTSQNEAVFFTINGQTHASLGRSFLVSKAKLGHLADHMLVHIDCTDLETGVMINAFKGSRDRMRNSETVRQVQTALAEELRKHEGLRELNNLRRQQQIMKNPKNRKFVEAVVERLITRNRFLANYLGLGGPVKPGAEPGKTPIEEYVGRRIPAFLRRRGKSGVKKIPVNSYAWLRLETDACNDYLTRDVDGGKLLVSPDIAGSYRLWNGVITIRLVPPVGVVVGKRSRLKVQLTRPHDDPLAVTVDMEYVGPVKKTTKPSGKRGPKTGQSYQVPEPILVYRDHRNDCITWEQLGWNGEDVAKVIPSGDRDLDIYINMDADALHSYLRLERRSDAGMDRIKGLYQICIFLHALVLYNDLSQVEIEDVDAFLPEVMKSIAKISLDLIDNSATDDA
jgi:hypothetical protein